MGIKKSSKRSLLRKAQVNLDMMTNAKGVLPVAYAKQFLDVTVESSRLMGMATVVPLRAPKQRTNKIDMPGRVIRPGREATALPAADRAAPEFAWVEHDAQLFKGEIELTDEALEDNIEGEGFRNTVMRALGKAWARDTEELVLRGDTASTDASFTALRSFDGILKKATSNIVNCAGRRTDRYVLRDLFVTLPEVYRRDKRVLRFLTSSNAEIAYRESLASRATSLGDAAIGAVGDVMNRVGYVNIPIVDIPLLPDTLGVGGNTTQILLTDPTNVEVGIWRRIRMESDRDVRKGVVFTVITVRMDVVWQHEPAVSKAINIDPSMPAAA